MTQHSKTLDRPGKALCCVYVSVRPCPKLKAPKSVDNSNNNKRICIAPYGRKFRGALE